ncbi:hypothetical protein JCM24511_02134 [Saitozyma sp. JCM 24511]|nr:hypothetical protein JCM24511_02134 [Saitozyma sp. JCM 24511]
MYCEQHSKKLTDVRHLSLQAQSEFTFCRITFLEGPSEAAPLLPSVTFFSTSILTPVINAGTDRATIALMSLQVVLTLASVLLINRRISTNPAMEDGNIFFIYALNCALGCVTVAKCFDRFDAVTSARVP